MVDGRTTRWAGHRDRRRTEILAAAVRTIDDVGPGARVDQMAAGAGISRQVLYRYFDDRGDLERAIADHAATLLVEHLAPQLALQDGIEAGVRQALTAYLEFINNHLSLYRFVRAQGSDSSPAAVRRAKDTIADTIIGLARHLVRDPARVNAAFTETTALALVGMADAVIAAWLDDPRDLGADELLDQLVALATGLIRATSGTRSR